MEVFSKLCDPIVFIDPSELICPAVMVTKLPVDEDEVEVVRVFSAFNFFSTVSER